MLPREVSRRAFERFSEEYRRTTFEGILNGLSALEPVVTSPEFVSACLEASNIQTADIAPWLRYTQALISHIKDALRPPV
jgi:hypothetical protein